MTQTLLTQDQRLEYMLRLARIARQTGQAVLQLGPRAVFDTGQVGHHYFSTVDGEAGRIMRGAIADIMADMPVAMVEEAEIAQRTGSEIGTFTYPLIVADGLEGSVNGKRGLTAVIQGRPIHSGTSLMLLENESLGSLAASAFFDFSSECVFSAVRGEHGSFISFVDEKVVYPSDVRTTQGDSQSYAIVPGYSHGDIQARADVEKALLQAGIYPVGGSGSSAQDLLDIACNRRDAYVDARTCFPGTTNRCDAVLRPWDVGGVLPFLDGLGLMVVDPSGHSWQQYKFFERIALIVARPSIGPDILAAVKQLPFIADHPKNEPAATVPYVASVS